MTKTLAITTRDTKHGPGSTVLPKGTLIEIRPATNLPADSPIKVWADNGPGNLLPKLLQDLADGAGIGLHEGDYEPVTEALRKSANDARFIYEGGGCNPSGLARALVTAVDAGRASAKTDKRQTDPAYAPARMIVSQIAFLFGQGIGDYGNIETDRVICKGLTGPIPSLGDKVEKSPRERWMAGWVLWVRWGGREECASTEETAGFDAAAKANENGGERPTASEAAEACPIPAVA